MRLIEFVLDEGFKNISGIGVITNNHAIDQAKARNIPEHVLNVLTKKIPYVKSLFSGLEENQKFYIWSEKLNAGIGLRKRSDKEGYMRVEIMTTINKLFDSQDPVFTIR